MKLDSFTVKVLQNFSNINNGIVINKGSEIRTIPESKTILAEAIVPDVFPEDFAIADLRKFLGCLSIYQNPELEFSDKQVTIVSGANSINFFYCQPDLITRPTKRITLPSQDVTVLLREEDLGHINKTAQILSCDDVLFQSSADGKLTVTILDKSNPTSDSSSIELTGNYNSSFKAYLKVSNLKMISGDYDIIISAQGISKFINKNHKLEYFVAVESDSTF